MEVIIMKLSYIEKILLLLTVFMLICFSFNKLTNKSVKISQTKVTQRMEEKVLNLGMTFEEFREIYEEKVLLNGSPIISLDNAEIEENENAINFTFKDIGIMMVIFKEAKTEKINRIAVLAEPFRNHTETEKIFLLVAQSTVWSLAAQVFSSNMEQQKYRESAIKRLYSSMNQDYMMNGNIRYKAVQNGKVVALFIEAKDLPN